MILYIKHVLAGTLAVPFLRVDLYTLVQYNGMLHWTYPFLC
jgi:hypothetical protein